VASEPLHLAVALDSAGWHPAAWCEPGARVGLVPTVTTTHTEPFHVSEAEAELLLLGDLAPPQDDATLDGEVQPSACPRPGSPSLQLLDRGHPPAVQGAAAGGGVPAAGAHELLPAATGAGWPASGGCATTAPRSPVAARCASSWRTSGITCLP
jgi:hypothetical protein